MGSWAENEPNNAPVTKIGEDCVVLHVDNKMNDIRCSARGKRLTLVINS